MPELTAEILARMQFAFIAIWFMSVTALAAVAFVLRQVAV